MAHQALSETELDELESLLDSEALAGEAMGLDQLQAFLCAVSSAPQAVPRELWLPEALGQVEGEAGARARDLALRLQVQIADDLAQGEGVAPLLYPLEEDGDELDYGTWVDAYLFGTGLGEQPWQEAAGEHWEDLAELMEVFFLLNGSLKEDVLAAGEAWVSPREEARWVQESREALPELVHSVYDFWEARRNIPAPIRREGPKVGRNDPCPCGSGRKYKQCCGKETLH